MLSDNNSLLVVSTARKIRYLRTLSPDGLLPKIVCIDEFFKSAIYAPNLSECSQLRRVLFMHEAVKKTQNFTKDLNFPSEFFEFMKNSNYLFSFFKELVMQKKSVEDIKFSDIYANYEDHLTLLETLFSNYCEILRENDLYDEITIYKNYEINSGFLSEFKSINVEVDGILSKVEFDILISISEILPVNLQIYTSKLNRKMVEILENFCGEKFEFDRIYLVNLHDTTTKISPLNLLTNTIQTKEFELRSLQCAYVFEKISTFVRCGIEPKNIAVILPDESFSGILKLYDKNSMLNFAMGESFERDIYFRILSKINLSIKENINPIFYENSTEVSSFDEFSLFFHFAKISPEIYHKFRLKFNQIINFSEFKILIDEAVKDVSLSSDILKQLNGIFFELEILFSQIKLTLKDAIGIFLLQIKNIKIADTKGGLVSVLGILETRGNEFDGVIIVDFNDDLVPKRSVNEMFLSSQVRKRAGLISYTDRENLQRFYYERLIKNAKKVAICYQKDEEKLPSRFLKNFTHINDESYSDDDYLRLFADYKRQKFVPEPTDEISLKHDIFKAPISFSKLDTFLKCKRKYYYRYILNLSEPKGFDADDPTLKGSILHSSLKELYQKNARFDLQLFKEIYSKNAAKLPKIEKELMIFKFDEFGKFIKEFEKNSVQISVEKEIETKFCGKFIKGIIDRIDKNIDGKFIITDYKSGSADRSSLQLAFYEALLKGAKNDENLEVFSQFYSFKTMEVISSTKDLNDLIQIFDELKTLPETITFQRAQIPSACIYCAYKTVCKKEF
ncbi:MAG: PD-(D/E)XK nuclease family protein [Campylobacter sp.]|nr:PD-(D/E)XK nuclease family protein [Campylobacter sp.]